MRTITTEDLKVRLERREAFKLVMAFDDWRFEAAHIPGSIGVGSPAAAMAVLTVEDDIVVYCTSHDCPASQLLYRALDEAGYTKVQRYPDGVEGWRQSGLTLEGERVS
jgi:rhodanese-related sulfurtransferase